MHNIKIEMNLYIMRYNNGLLYFKKIYTHYRYVKVLDLAEIFINKLIKKSLNKI